MKPAVIFAALVCLVGLALANPVVPRYYPLYMQCDPRWGNDPMNGTTICAEGCAMSCVSMALAGKNISIDGVPSNPQVLNKWLRGNNGYICLGGDCNNLVLDAPNRIDPGRITFISEKQKPDIKTLQSWVESDTTVAIAHVHNNHHFVLLVGYDNAGTSFYVNDPYYPNTYYDYADISDLLVYDMMQA